jgi:long-chain acyl-CoA synthetase
MQNFYEMFTATVARFPERPAILVQRKDSLDTITYAGLRDMAEAIAAFLASRGIGAGARCAILSDNDARWVAAYLGAFRLGAVAVPLDTAYKAKQIAALLKDSGAQIIFTSEKFLDAVREAVSYAGSQAQIVLLFGSHDGLPTLDDVVGAHGNTPLQPCPATPADPAVMLYTSGTTSDPKGVVLTHGNLIAESESVFERVKVNEKDSLLGVLPLFHALSQMASLLLPFIVGASVVYLETLNTTEVLRALRERGISIFVCVPQFFYLIYERVTKEVAGANWLKRTAFRNLLRLNALLRRSFGTNLGRKFFAPVHAVLGERMRLLVTGGSRFDPQIGGALYALGFNIIQAYGLTECSGAATLMKEGDAVLGSVGHPLRGVDIKILPSESDAAKDTRVPDGEVCIRGGIVMQGYFNRPDANAETLKDGWLHTGDLGYLDSDGRVYITGRIKEIIVTSSGKNIYPEEIEAHYLQSPYIKELCVMGLTRPGEPTAERLHAVVVPNFDVLRERKVLNAKEILRFEIESLAVQLPSHKRVLSYEIWNEDLPRTTTRKLKRFQIAARVNAQPQHEEEESVAASRSVRDEDEQWAAQPAVARALDAIRDAARNKEALHPAANIELELGMDSMERVELLTHLEEMFGTEVPDEVAHKIYTVRELVNAVTAGAQGGGAAVSKDAWGRLLHDLPEEDPVLRDLLKPKPIFNFVFFSAMRACYLISRIFLGLRVAGRERLPASGAFLLCPNHQSYLDVFLLLGALPAQTFRKLFFVGASEYFTTSFMRWIARNINLVPVDPDTNLTRAMQAGAYGLKHGKVLVLFPEGERSIDGKIKKFKKGAPILALHLGVPMVPIAVEGAHEVWPRGKSFRMSAVFSRNGRPPVRLTFGAPLPPPTKLSEEISFREAEAAYSSAAEALRSSVLSLAPSLM